MRRTLQCYLSSTAEGQGKVPDRTAYRDRGSTVRAADATADNRSTGGCGRYAASANTALRAASPVAGTLADKCSRVGIERAEEGLHE